MPAPVIAPAGGLVAIAGGVGAVEGCAIDGCVTGGCVTPGTGACGLAPLAEPGAIVVGGFIVLGAVGMGEPLGALLVPPGLVLDCAMAMPAPALSATASARIVFLFITHLRELGGSVFVGREAARGVTVAVDAIGVALATLPAASFALARLLRTAVLLLLLLIDALLVLLVLPALALVVRLVRHRSSSHGLCRAG
jgi:hypothetical protein